MGTVTLSPWERQRVRRFAAAVDGGQVHDRSVSELFALATAMGIAGDASPRPADTFKVSLRQRLLAVAAVNAVSGTSGGAAAPVPTSWRRRMAAAGTAIAIATGGVAGTAMASAGALPGDTLYDVKRIVESLQIALSLDDAAKGKQYLEIAGIRLSEVAGLLEESGPRPTSPVLVEQLSTTLGDMGTALQLGREHLLAAYEATGDPSVLAKYSSSLRALADLLASLTPMLPEEVIEQQAEMLTAFREVAQLVASVSILPAPTGEPGAATPGAEGAPAAPPANAPGLINPPGSEGGIPDVGGVNLGTGAPSSGAPAGSGGQGGSGVATPAPGLPLTSTETNTTLPSTATVLETLEEITSVLPEVEAPEGELPPPGQ